MSYDFSVELIPVADPEFPRGGRSNPPGGAKIRFGQNFPKTARIERIWIRGGVARPKFYYVDPPLDSFIYASNVNLKKLEYVHPQTMCDFH